MNTVLKNKNALISKKHAYFEVECLFCLKNCLGGLLVKIWIAEKRCLPCIKGKITSNLHFKTMATKGKSPHLKFRGNIQQTHCFTTACLYFVLG